ncbi:sugar phosphate isomerase/epimerase [Cryobacterium melibiosiphilum]|uniref:Sugar phosphate isomerase/epimerase n=1 Tax=Cryobacterium melibiosiphilum TaxID=995039 RepID=A0A3A5MUI5_9MICO|nr:sugar phosphate isomerase/epimerase [Cryobacterium melibiosiphilum]RJT89666.1 sugar phosphate isomerase/epimerase [Cryobacterium melibiosiphilum]
MSENSNAYSVQLYSVRHALEADLPGTIAKLAAIGFTRVEPYNFVATASALRVALDANGLTAPTGHAPLMKDDQREIFEAARGLGITTVIDPFLAAENWTTEADIRATAGKLNAAAALGEEYGIRVGYHNHAWEIENQIDGRTGLEVLAEHLDPRVLLEVDTYWAAVGGADPVELLARLGDRVRFIHIKDGPISTDVNAQQPAGQGSMNVPAVIAAAASLEVGVVEFDSYAGDIFDGLAQSLAFLTGAEAAVSHAAVAE